MKIFLTAGHSLKQGGSSSEGKREEKLTIELRDIIAKQLREWGVNVVVDNDSDNLSTVISKIKKVATFKDLLFDIHFNASSNKKTTGTECFIAVNARDRSQRIATRVAELSSGMLGIPNRGVKRENESQHSRLGILHTAASSVLYEAEFLTNEKGMENYDSIKNELGIGIANILQQELYK